MTTCTHPHLISINGTRCGGYTHCPDCGYESTPAGHIWLPAGINADGPQVCARCNAAKTTPRG